MKQRTITPSSLANQLMRLIIQSSKDRDDCATAAKDQEIYDRANCLGKHEGSTAPRSERINAPFVSPGDMDRSSM